MKRVAQGEPEIQGPFQSGGPFSYLGMICCGDVVASRAGFMAAVGCFLSGNVSLPICDGRRYRRALTGYNA